MPSDVIAQAGPALAQSNDTLRKNLPPGPFTPSEPLLENAVSNASDWASKLSLTDVPYLGRVVKDYRDVKQYRMR